MVPEFTPPLLSIVKPHFAPIKDGDATLNNDPASQLEGRWSGVEALTPSRKKAFQQLIARIRQEKALEGRWAYLLLGQAPLQDDADDLVDVRLSRPALQQPAPAEIQFDKDGLQLIEDRAVDHAWLGTVTIAMIDMAKRASGILPSTDFMWTRTADPRFWQLMNSYGRPRHLIGAAAAYAHFEMEKRIGKAVVETHFHRY